MKAAVTFSYSDPSSVEANAVDSSNQFGMSRLVEILYLSYHNYRKSVVKVGGIVPSCRNILTRDT